MSTTERNWAEQGYCGYIEADNSSSLRVSQLAGYESIATFKTAVFSRLRPREHAGLRRLEVREKTAAVADLEALYDPFLRRVTPGILPYALRASLRLFKIAPGDFVAPKSKHRARVTPARRGKGRMPKRPDEAQDPTPTERRASMTWAQRLKRVCMRHFPLPPLCEQPTAVQIGFPGDLSASISRVFARRH